MRALDRKLLRELGRSKGQVITIALVTACGISTYVSMASTYDAVWSARDAYYERQRFADVFARTKRAPLSVAARVAELPGVARVEDRVVVEVVVDLPTLPEPVFGRIVS